MTLRDSPYEFEQWYGAPSKGFEWVDAVGMGGLGQPVPVRLLVLAKPNDDRVPTEIKDALFEDFANLEAKFCPLLKESENKP